MSNTIPPENFPDSSPILLQEASASEVATPPAANDLTTWAEKASEPVTEYTATKYRQYYVMLMDRAAKHLGTDPAFITPAAIVAEIDSDPTIAVGTKNTYRSAVVWALERSGFEFDEDDRLEGLKAVRAFRPRLSRSTSDIPDLATRRYRTRARSIPEEDLGPLLNALLSAKITSTQWAAKTTTWLNAGIATGARPNEWETAYWLDFDRRILRLPNSKLKKQAPFNWSYVPARLMSRAESDLVRKASSDELSPSEDAAGHIDEFERNIRFFDAVESSTAHSNGMALDTLRRLRAWELHNASLAWRDIEVPARWVGAVNAHMTHIRDYLAGGGDRTFQRLFNGCRAALAAACKRAFPDGRMYSLYDTRSTAAANMQASMGADRAALVMGHYKKRKRTIKENYAGADRAFSRAGKFSPALADTQNQRDQAELRSGPTVPAGPTLMTLGETPSSPGQPDLPAP
ncbi:hypothetical protein ACSFA0_04320 [Variovorax sp. LT1P1]|uniref:hypothetical protein n=1 Tax=Variovorax sp. LT1P1 TaxID=3443730 RepID=UPI003F4587E5